MPKLMINFYTQQLFVSSQSYNKCLPGIHDGSAMDPRWIRDSTPAGIYSDID